MSSTSGAGILTLSSREWKDLLEHALPAQGAWSDEQYLILTDQTNLLVEFTDGYLEEVPMPTDQHQAILEFLFLAFHHFIKPSNGRVRFAPLRLRIRPSKFREPDLLLLLSAADPRRQDRFWTGADLAVEIVSPEKPERALIQKRADYAEARIPEYWIIDPRSETITVLRLEAGAYREAGLYQRGQNAASVLMSGFAVEVAAVFDVD